MILFLVRRLDNMMYLGATVEWTKDFTQVQPFDTYKEAMEAGDKTGAYYEIVIGHRVMNKIAKETS